VFGAFDITGSEIAVTDVALFRLGPMKVYAGGAGERATSPRNGEFYAPNLSPGVYAVESFYSGNQPFSLQGPEGQHLPGGSRQRFICRDL
jgi:hypothetical protein